MKPRIFQDTLVADLGSPHRVLSHAVFNGGFRTARFLINQQVYERDKGRDDAAVTLKARAKALGLSVGVVGMMTGADVTLRRLAKAKRGLTCAHAVATAGLFNGGFIGERGSFDEARHVGSLPKPGTINLWVTLNQALTDTAMIEALALLAHARTVAVLEYSQGKQTGSGTDCIALACPIQEPKLRWAGMHTVVGELLGRAAKEAVSQALEAWPGKIEMK